MVTAGTYRKSHYFSTPDLLDFLNDNLFDLALRYSWNLQAWAIMSNHYHFVAIPEKDPGNLSRMISHLHTLTAKQVNIRDKKPGRKIWFQYWDTHLFYEKSYFARLKYVHYNPVHHGVVELASNYKWCSAVWFEKNAPDSFAKRISMLKIDRVNVLDDF